MIEGVLADAEAIVEAAEPQALREVDGPRRAGRHWWQRRRPPPDDDDFRLSNR
jgi:hypothetical protein